MRRLNPVHKFALLGGVCIAGLSAVLGFASSFVLEEHMRQSEWASTADLVKHELSDLNLTPYFIDPQLRREAARRPEAFAHLRQLPEVVRIKLWDREARILWTDEAPLIGRSFPENVEVKEALAGRVAVKLKSWRELEQKYGREQFAGLVEIYVPVPSQATDEIVGAVEVYKSPSRLFASIRRMQGIVWGIGLSGGLLLYVVLLPIVRRTYRKELELEGRLHEYTQSLELLVQQRTQRLRHLNALSQLVASSLDYQPVFEYIVRAATELIEDSVACLWMHDAASEGFSRGACLGMRHPHMRTVSCMGPEADLLGEAAVTGHPVIIREIAADPRFKNREWARAEGLHAGVWIPLSQQGQALGVLSVLGRMDRPFTDNELETLTSFANQAAIAVRNAQLYDAIRRELLERKRAEEALRQTEERYRNLFEHAPVMYVITENREGGPITLDCNELFLRTLGYSQTEVLGRPLADFYTPESRCQLMQGGGYQRALRGEFVAEERQLVTGDGHVIETLLQAVPRVQADGRVSGTHAIHVDITERKRAEEALQARARQQAIVAGLGQRALGGTDLSTLLDESVAQIARILNVEYCKVLELLPGGNALRLRAGVGWKDGCVGHATVGAGTDSQAGYTLLSREPVIVEDLRSETRFSGPPLLHEHGVVSGLSVIIHSHDRPFGVLGAHTSRRRTFTRDDIHFLQAIANVLAAAIERRRAEEAVATRTRQLEAVRAVTAEIARELDLTTLLNLIVSRAAELVAAEAGVVFLWDEGAEVLIPQAWHGFGDWMGQLRVRIGEGVAGTAVQRGEGLIVNDFRAWPFAHPVILERTRIAAVLGEPLFYRDRLLGVITLCNEEPGRPFTEEDRELLTLFATEAAIAIENARLYSATALQLREMTALYDMSRAIASNLNLGEQLEALLERLIQAAGAQRATVCLLDTEDAGRCGLRVAYDGSKADPWLRHLDLSREGYPELKQAVQTRRPLVIPDIFTEPLLAPVRNHLEPLGLRSLVVLPLIVREQALGAIRLGYVGRARTFTADEIRFCQSMADLAAAAIANAQLFARVAQAKAEWEHTFDSIPDLVAVVDAEYRLIRVNRAVGERLGVAPKDLVGRRCYTALHGTETPLPGCPHAQTLVTGKPTTLEIEEPHLGGMFLITTSPLFNAGEQPVGCVHIVRDITEMKRLEEEARQRQRFEDLSRAKSAFIATMSHELRTPLNSVLGFSELLQEQRIGPLTEKQVRYLGHIQESGKHLLNPINDILDVSRAEAGKIELARQPVSLDAMVEVTLNLVHPQAEKAGVTLVSEIPPGFPPVLADAVRLKQILFNLASNAVKFTPEGGTISVRARRVPGDFRLPIADCRLKEPGGPNRKSQIENRQSGEWLEIAVTDTGVGIRPEDIPKLFKEFGQLEAGKAPEKRGTGLGLALTKKLVELHGGRIWATSDGEGRGSTFTVVLPLGGPPDVGE